MRPGPHELDDLIRSCYERGLVARHAVTREGAGLRVDLKDFHYPDDVAMVSKVSELGLGYIVRWVGRASGVRIGEQWYSSADAAMAAIEEVYRAKEAAWRLTGPQEHEE